MAGARPSMIQTPTKDTSTMAIATGTCRMSSTSSAARPSKPAVTFM